MCPAVPMICWVTASLPCHVVACCHNCSCLLCWSFWIATSDGSLLPYLKFACSIEPCGLLLWSPILPIQRPSLPALYGKWFMVDIGSGKFLHRRSFSVTVLVGVCLQGQVPHIGLPWNLPAVPDIFGEPPPNFDGTSSKAHQLEMSLIQYISTIIYYLFYSQLNGLSVLSLLVFFSALKGCFLGTSSFTKYLQKLLLTFLSQDVKHEQERIQNTNIIVCTPGRLLQHMDETPIFNCNSLQVLGM